MFSSIKSNDFFQNVSKLLTGSVIAQVVPLAFTPILTRIYSPEEFGVLGVYIALVTIVGVVVTGRYELAITQPKNDKDGNSLFFISVLISILVTFVSLFIILAFDDLIKEALKETDLSYWLYLVPLSILFLGVFQSLSYLVNRNKQYSSIAKSKVTQSFTALSGNLSLSKVASNGGGLIAGHLLGQLLAVVYLIYAVVKAKLFEGNKVSLSDLKRNAIKYKRFPLISVPGALLNTLALQIPVLFISKTFDLLSVGYFNFIYRIIGGPMSLLSVAVSQVLIQKLSVKDEDVYRLIKSLSVKLFLISLPAIFIVYFSGPDLFGFIFGDKWVRAGELAKILIFSIAIRFVVSPLSMVLAIEKNLKLGFIWQVYSCISVVTCIFIFAELPLEKFLIMYVVQDVIAYSLYYVMILYGAKRL